MIAPVVPLVGAVTKHGVGDADCQALEAPRPRSISAAGWPAVSALVPVSQR